MADGWLTLLTAILTAASAIVAVIVTNNYNTKRDREHHRWQVEQEKLNFERAARAERGALLRREYGAVLECATRISEHLTTNEWRFIGGPAKEAGAIQDELEKLSIKFGEAYAILGLEADASEAIVAAMAYRAASYRALNQLIAQSLGKEDPGKDWSEGLDEKHAALRHTIQEHLRQFEID